MRKFDEGLAWKVEGTGRDAGPEEFGGDALFVREPVVEATDPEVGVNEGG